jgi:hypothetical protein
VPLRSQGWIGSARYSNVEQKSVTSPERKEAPNADEPFAKGHCLCGAVSYTIQGKAIRMAQCHCKDCQRASGTGHMSLAFFKKDEVAIAGKTASYPSTADSGNINTRHFCPTCGSRVYGENSARPGVIGITVGCLDKNDWFSPQAVVYTQGRAAWDKTPEDVPNFERMPPPPR